MKRIAFWLMFLLIQVISHLPFRVMYWLSDVFYFLCYHVVGYRRKVVASNLASSFPDKSKEELKAIEKEFYAWFCDILLESIKAFNMTQAQLDERVVFDNIEEMEQHVNNGHSVFIDMAHTGPWEWVPTIYHKYFSHIVGAELYRHVSNPYLDDFFLKARQRFGTMVIPKDKAIRPLAQLHKDGKIFGLGLLADQTPSRGNLHFWTDFLHHDTPFLQGPERLAKMFKSAVIYLDMYRVERGYYHCRIFTITPDASKEEDGMVTKKYANLLEETIQRNPALWFWTHRRWKYDHQQILKEQQSKKA